MDHARDLLHMINHFRPQRPLIGVGHSLGGNELVNLALLHPRLFSTLVLLDPVIQRHQSSDPQKGETGRGPARLSTFRRDLWPSPQAAVDAFSKQKFYQQWDPRVLQRWLDFGIRNTPTKLYPDVEGGATLTTTKHQEVFTFLRPMSGKKAGAYDLATRDALPDVDPDLGEDSTMPFYRPEPPLTFARLPWLRPSTLYVFGELSDMSSPSAQADKINNTGTAIGGSGGVKEGRVQSVTMKGIGHLVAMEDVHGCADALTPWVGKELQRWRDEEEQWKRWRDGKSALEKVTLSEEWKANIGGPFTRPSKGKL
jgi:pimeloyl-ACP methyl ester carboxylesterase